MSKFKSLEDALEGHYEKSLAELPDDLRQWVERVFVLISWDDPFLITINFNRRRQTARQWDWEHHPANKEDNELLWDKILEIDKWERVSTPTALDIDKQESKLAELNRQVALASERVMGRARGTATADGAKRVAVDWLVREYSRRRRSGEDFRLPAMEVALHVEHPELSKDERRELLTNTPKVLKATRGRKKGSKKSSPD